MAEEIQVDRWVSKETLVHPWMGPAYFNSSLDTNGISATQNAKLTIHLRLWLEWVKPKTPKNAFIDWPKVKNFYNNQWVPWLVEWDSNDLEPFKFTLKKNLDSFWGSSDPTSGNPGFCLMPIGWTGLDWPLGNSPTHRANVDCDFEIVYSKGPDDAHVMFYCVTLVPPALRKPLVPLMHFLKPGTEDTTGVGLIAKENSSAYGVCGDPSAKVPAGTSPVQVCFLAAHEIGHGLGMPHIGVSKGSRQCMEDALGSNFVQKILTEVGLRAPDQDVISCYIGDTNEDAQNIMGFGRKVTFANAMPWLLRLTEHTHTRPEQWMICMGKRSPTPLSWLSSAGRG